jgi:long-chain fatty acid transport protein
MKTASLRIAAVASALALAAPAAATNGMRVIGFSPVQNAMGGVSAAAPLDATTIVSNPAGMTALDRRVDVGGTAYLPTVKYSASGAASGSSIDSDRPPDFIPTVAAIYKTTENLTVGVAALGVAGLGVDYKADLYGSETLTSYRNMRLAPAVGYRLTDRVSLGVAANLSYAQLEYKVLGAMGNPPRDATGAFGVGATVGLTYAAPEKYTVAVVYETRNWFQEFSWDLPGLGTEKMRFDQPDILTVGTSVRPLQALVVAADLGWIRWSSTNGTNKPAFTEQTPATPSFDMDWSDQFVFKLGAQYDVTKAFAIRAGYNYGSAVLNANRAFENIAFPAVVKSHYTVGAGYAFGAFALNAAAMYAPEEKVTGSNAAQGIASYETSVSQLAFDLGASWKF